MFGSGLGRKTVATLADISDDELVVRISQVMWHITKRKDRTPLMPELEQCYAETIQRGKPHLWSRAKDCFRANNPG